MRHTRRKWLTSIAYTSAHPGSCQYQRSCVLCPARIWCRHQKWHLPWTWHGSPWKWVNYGWIRTHRQSCTVIMLKMRLKGPLSDRARRGLQWKEWDWYQGQKSEATNLQWKEWDWGESSQSTAVYIHRRTIDKEERTQTQWETQHRVPWLRKQWQSLWSGTQLPQDSRNNDWACGVQYTTPQDSTGALERCSDTAQATTTNNGTHLVISIRHGLQCFILFIRINRIFSFLTFIDISRPVVIILIFWCIEIVNQIREFRLDIVCQCLSSLLFTWVSITYT